MSMRILHTMLRVGDLDRSIAFYTRVLGMRLLRKTERPEHRYTLAFVYRPRSFVAGAIVSALAIPLAIGAWILLRRRRRRTR